MIGIRGPAYDFEDRDFAEAVGIRVIPIEEFFARGVDDVMAEARERAGSGDTYVSYDIDFVDPAYAPGTGTPEVGGPTSWQALQVARGLRGVKVVGADLVEVSPPFDAVGRDGLSGRVADVRDALRDRRAVGASAAAPGAMARTPGHFAKRKRNG